MIKKEIKRKIGVLAVGLVALTGFNGCQMADFQTKVDEKGPAANIKVRKADIGETRAISGRVDSYEPDDTASQATLIDRNMAAQEHTFFSDDTDWFKFTANQYEAFKIETTVYSGTDTYLYLYSSSDLTNPIAQNDDKDGINDRGSRIDWMCEASGTYYVKCYSFNGDTGINESYDIVMMDPSVSGDSFENDDTAALAKPITTNGVPQYHNFRDDTVDWLKFDVSTDHYYIIETVVNGLVNATHADTVLELYDSETATSYVAENDDINSGYNRGSRIVYKATAGKTMYLKVREFYSAGPGKDYSISVTKAKLLMHNQFNNGSYDSWHLYDNTPAAASLSNSNGQLKVHVTNEGNYKFDIGLYQEGIELVKGKTYTFLFDGRVSSSEKDIYVGFEESYYPNADYCSFRYYRLNTNLATYRSTFTMNAETDPNAQYIMYMGKVDGNNVTYPKDFYFDNMMIFENKY